MLIVALINVRALLMFGVRTNVIFHKEDFSEKLINFGTVVGRVILVIMFLGIFCTFLIKLKAAH